MVRASGVTAYGVALAVGLAVAVGGLSFAAGRMTADQPSTGGGRLAALAAGGGAGSARAPLPDAGLGSGAFDHGVSSGAASVTEAEGGQHRAGPIDVAAGGGRGTRRLGCRAERRPVVGPGFPPAGPGASRSAGSRGRSAGYRWRLHADDG